MPFNNTALGQLLKTVPRLDFEKLANAHDGKRRSDALPRWSQFVALTVGQLGSHHSLRDIEAVLATQHAQHYHSLPVLESEATAGSPRERCGRTVYPESRSGGGETK